MTRSTTGKGFSTHQLGRYFVRVEGDTATVYLESKPVGKWVISVPFYMDIFGFDHAEEVARAAVEAAKEVSRA